MLTESVGVMANLCAIAIVLVVATVLVLLIRDKIRRGYSKNIFLNTLPFLFAMMFYFFIVAVQKQRLMTMLISLKIERIKWG